MRKPFFQKGFPQKEKMKIIGISATLEEGTIKADRAYSDALLASGALPIILAPTCDADIIKEAADRLDGILFAGGGDILPARYGDLFCHAENSVCEERDEFEFLLFEEFERRKKPMLGICRGMQLINVARGGTLFQNIGGHMRTGHDVSLFGYLAEISGEKRAQANSFHRQAVKKLGNGLCVLAVSEDSIIEAIGDFERGYLIGVQFHPEKTFNEDDLSRKIIEDFVKSCEKRLI